MPSGGGLGFNSLDLGNSSTSSTSSTSSCNGGAATNGFAFGSSVLHRASVSSEPGASLLSVFDKAVTGQDGFGGPGVEEAAAAAANGDDNNE